MGDHKCGIMTLLPDHWKTLVNSIRCGTVQRLYFNDVDLSALDDDVFLLVCPSCSRLRFEKAYSTATSSTTT
ncbi:hypothetical protein AAVH_41015 [Aphelenchoides avenae]|nr:hypothetical protein AAVH_41015 [Aphelenchus avenae]